MQGIVFGSHQIAFHSLEPLPRQKSTSQKACFINTFAGFSSARANVPLLLHSQPLHGVLICSTCGWYVLIKSVVALWWLQKKKGLWLWPATALASIDNYIISSLSQTYNRPPDLLRQTCWCGALGQSLQHRCTQGIYPTLALLRRAQRSTRDSCRRGRCRLIDKSLQDLGHLLLGIVWACQSEGKDWSKGPNRVLSGSFLFRNPHVTNHRR